MIADGTPPEVYTITLLNHQGNTLDETSDHEFLTPETTEGRNDLTRHDYYTMVGAIFEEARRIALGTDKAYDDILEALGSGV